MVLAAGFPAVVSAAAAVVPGKGLRTFPSFRQIKHIQKEEFNFSSGEKDPKCGKWLLAVRWHLAIFAWVRSTPRNVKI